MFEIYFQNGSSVTATSLDMVLATLRFRRDIKEVTDVVYKWREPQSYKLYEETVPVQVRTFEDLERVLRERYGLRRYSF